MPVSVKEYLNSMSSVSSSTKASRATANDTKMQALLSQLIEAIAYANSVDFRTKTLNAQAPGTAKAGETGRQVLDNMKAQEKLVKQLAEGQKLTNAQNKELKQTIDKFYELIGAQEVNYKTFAKNLEKFALQDLPQAVQNRLINDSRDAHMIGQSNKRSEGPILPIIKRIRNLLEDSAENTKQFTKKLFVSLDAFKAGLLGAFDKLGELFEENGIGGFIKNIGNLLNTAGMLWMGLQDQFKQGNFKWGQGIKQFDNIKTMFKAFKEVGGIGAGLEKSFKTMTNGIKSIKNIFKTFSRLPKFFAKFGKMGGLAAAGKSVGKSIGKGLGKNALKKIPVLGLALSGFMAWERWQKKDYLGAMLELASGTASIFPGIGTAISIGIDLINLGRDTGAFKDIGKKAGNAAKNALPSLSEDLLMTIPGIGPIYGITKSIKLFKSGNKKGGMAMIGKSLASIIPGGAMLADMLIHMMGIDTDIKPGSKPTGTSGSWSGFRWPWQRGGGSGYYGPQLGGGSSLKSVDFGHKLANEANRVAFSSSHGKCGLYVGNAVARTLGEGVASHLRGNGSDWAKTLKSPTGKKYFTSRGTENNLNNLRKLPAGSILSWPAAGRHVYGHVEIADGRGNLISDFRRPAGQIYRDTPNLRPSVFTPKGVDASEYLAGLNSTANSTPNAGTSSDYSSEELETPKTFGEIMDMFNKFNQDIVAGMSTGVADTGHYEFPTISASDLSAGTPAASTASATTSMKSSSKPAQNSFAVAPKQISTTMPKSSSPDSIDTEIRDTDLMLLNSILFS